MNTAFDGATLARMVEAMAALQERHNREVAEDWRTRGLAYDRAIWVECAELLDHFGWKWWKRQQPDFDQVELELVDIWHFGLSMLIRDGGLERPADAAFATRLAAALPPQRRAPAQDPERFRVAVETLASSAVTDKRFDVDAFLTALAWLGVDAAGLYASYIGKNVLNSFRQRNGYKDGSYRKLWAGREDNEHLVELVAGLDVRSTMFADELAKALAERYREST